ncbi:hypothetical protein [Embleya scabrispora]|uniref:hypothetical protein n=1 Tax=Embleya scabrispora TaxID=159449 RepID=UPI00037BFB9C|nr:hypothetical protein [Embleya scabrispora]MYS86374.1 hypothetical protein [Streptomyces sp. SID5474]
MTANSMPPPTDTGSTYKNSGGTTMGNHAKDDKDGDAKTPQRQRDGQWDRPVPPEDKDRDKERDK